MKPAIEVGRFEVFNDTYKSSPKSSSRKAKRASKSKSSRARKSTTSSSDKARVGKLAQKYRKQGMSLSESMKRAWREVR